MTSGSVVFRRLPMLGAVVALALVTSGCSLWGWGLSHTIGDGRPVFVDEHTPVQVGTSTDWAVVSDGGGNVCGIQTDGSLWCWGLSGTGQLGDGTNNPSDTAEHIGTATWKYVTGPSGHTCGIQSNDSLWCWGYDAFGQVGDGTTGGNRLSPVHIGAASWKSIATGDHHTCGIQSDDSLWCWGYNGEGRVGTGAELSQSVPFRIGTASWQSVTTGADHTCGIRSDHTLWCWGRNVRGQLGDGTRLEHSSPVQVGAAHWSTVSAGLCRTCGLHTNATLWCWGDNTGNTLGTGTPFAVRLRPGQVGTANDWVMISNGVNHQCGIRRTGSDLTTVWCWGLNHNGQIGDGTTDPATSPEQIGDADHWTWVSAGGFSTHALLHQPEN
jgi:hypothetical protein